METTYTIKPCNDHFELYINGKLYCSTDTEAEAENELKAYEAERKEMQ